MSLTDASESEVTRICRRASAAAAVLRELDTAAKDLVLAQIADAIDAGRDALKAANRIDVDQARAAGVSATLVDRLTLTDARISGMVSSIRTVTGLPDPVGQVVAGRTRPNGLLIEHVREPLGVVAVIYEARPNVTADVAALCLKSGNAAVLRGSSIAAHTNAAIADLITGVLAAQDQVPVDAVQLIRDNSREAVLELLAARDWVDLLVPRGGPSLIQTVREHAQVPVVIDGDGNCHVYVDESADPAMATDIVVNAKTSRPSVCNAAVLRGSSIAASTNAAIADVITDVLAAQDQVPVDAVQLIRDNSREAVLELLAARDWVDLLVPRGGPSLIQTVREHAQVPVVIDGDGNCHVYVDESADPAMATDIVVNAKTSRPSVCNAAETLLVHAAIAPTWLPGALAELDKAGVVIRGDGRVQAIWPAAEPATEADWATEYLDLVLAVRVVDDLDEALAHIARWGTRNSEAVVARDIGVARRFARAVDSGSVFVNCSTRFSDGGEFGYGLEIGVSTQKLHARGPMGLEALTCVKNVTWGSGQVRR